MAAPRVAPKDALVLGAGMVGVTTALALQARGWSVVLVDRSEPGRETSYGNAGVIQAEAVEPYALPQDVSTLVSIALGRNNKVHYSMGGLLSNAGRLLEYFGNSKPARHREISGTYSQLIRRATSDHGRLVAESGADALIKREGLRALYRSEAPLERDRLNAERLWREYGVRSRVLTGAELVQAEPALLMEPAGAIHWTDSWSCADPGRLVEAYASLFVSRGGRLCVGDAKTLARAGRGWSVVTADGQASAECAVVALGPWTPELLRPFGLQIPMIRKRGYHRHFRTKRSLNIPLVDGQNGAVLAPMRAGLRVASGAEIASYTAPSSPVQLGRAEAAARELLELGDAVESKPWLGSRPCLPDMLPAVGRAKDQEGLWLNIGHGHQGFTLGPTTAELLARSMDGDDDPLMMKLSPSRLGC